MIAQDIVNQLSAIVPRFTTGFSESVGITSIVPTGDVALVTTDTAHGLVENQNVGLIGVEAPAAIEVASFLRTGSSAQFSTLQDHDLTLSERDKIAGGKTIVMSGAAETEFNGTFSLLRVINRREVVISVDDSGPTTISGSPIVEDANGQIFNGVFPATNVTPTTFEYQLPVTYALSAVVGAAAVQTSIRIASVLDIDQFLTDVYTKQTVGDDQLIVQLGDVIQSKRRNEETDADSSSIGNYTFTPMLIQPFAVYIIQNVTDELTGALARDRVESEYVPAIFSSVLRAEFDTGFTYQSFRATFTGHGVFAYGGVGDEEKHKTIYVHEVTFQQLAQLTKADMFDAENDVAMRDIGYTLTTDIGNQIMTAAVDLDEEPL